MLYSIPWNLDLGCLEKGEMVFRAGDFSQGISAFMAGATLWKQQGMCRQKKKKNLHLQVERGKLPAFQVM